MSTTDAYSNSLTSYLEQQIREYRGWYIFQGILFVILGLVALILPGVVALSLELLLGVLLLVGGIFGFITCIKGKLPWWSYISASLSSIVGFIMLWNPVFGLIALSLLVAIFLLLKGISEIALALQFRPLKSWGLLLVSGIISLILAAFAWLGFPYAGVLLIGIIIGINMLLYGISLLALTWRAK